MLGGIQSFLTNQQVKLRGCDRQLVPGLHQANPSYTVTLIILSWRRKLRLTVRKRKEKEYEEREEKILVCNGEMRQRELCCSRILSKKDNFSLICRVMNKDNKLLMYSHIFLIKECLYFHTIDCWLWRYELDFLPF